MSRDPTRIDPVGAGLDTQIVRQPVFVALSALVPAFQSVPVISGSLVEGSTLSVTTGGWVNTPTNFAYQWRRGGNAVLGATTSSYALTAADIGYRMDCFVTASNAAGSAVERAYATDRITASFGLPLAPVNTALPAISGTAQEGQILTVSNGSWTGSPTGYTYQWRRDGAAISGSINSTRTLTAADIGAVMSCTVTATNAGGSTAATSAGTAAVIAAAVPVPVNTVAPAVTGTGTIGSLLTSNTGTWTNSPTGYTYQWRRDGVDIAGATASTYALVSADGGKSVTCRVIATNAGGSAGATSNAIAVAAAAVPPAFAFSRPAQFIIASAGNPFGDSTTFGVGAPTGLNLPAVMRSGVSGPASLQGQPFHLLGTATNVAADYFGQGGQSGQNTATILSAVTYAKTNYATEITGRINFFSGGLNDYNSGVTGWARDWPAQVKANFQSMASQASGAPDWFFDLAPAESGQSQMGTVYAADHAFHRRDMIAAIGRRANDQARYLRFRRELELGTSYPMGDTADAVALRLGSIPWSCRGYPTTSGDFADGDPVPSTSTAAPVDSGQPDGSLHWNSSGNGLMSRKGTTGGWQTADIKHQGRYGNQRLAQMRRDMQAASEGSGGPYVVPVEFRCPINAAAGAVVGSIAGLVTGSATGYALYNLDGTVNTQFAISGSGQITRTASGALTDGCTTLALAAANGNGNLLSPIDIFVTRTAADTGPKMGKTIASPGVSIGARWASGLADGTSFSFAAWVRPTAIGGNQILMSMVRSSNNPGLVQITNLGAIQVVSVNSVGTSTAAATANSIIAAGTAVWVFVNVNTATGLVTIYTNDTVRANSPANAPSGTLLMGDANPVLLSGGAANVYKEVTSPLAGGFGFAAVWDSYIDWSVQANRRALMNVDLTPADRAPYAAVAGVQPRFEAWGNALGDLLHGTLDGSNSTRTTSISNRARELVA